MLTILKFPLGREFKKGALLIVLIALLIVIMAFTIWQSSKNLLEKKRNQNNSETILNQQDILEDKGDKEQVLPSPQIFSSSPATSPALGSSPMSVVTPQDGNAISIYTATKQNFLPIFSVSLANSTSSIPSEVNIEYGSNTGDWLGMGIKIVIPSGWEITAGTQLGQDLKIGEGVISAKLVGELSSSRFVVYNQINTEGHKAKWLFKFDNETYGERVFFADGDKNQGHLLFLDGAVGIPLSSPVSGRLTIFSSIITNPSLSGIFEWKIQYLFADGILESKKEVAIR